MNKGRVSRGGGEAEYVIYVLDCISLSRTLYDERLDNSISIHSNLYVCNETPHRHSPEWVWGLIRLNQIRLY